MLALDGATYITDFFILFEAASCTAEDITIAHPCWTYLTVPKSYL
jgi:hypothetical protein